MAFRMNARRFAAVLARRPALRVPRVAVAMPRMAVPVQTYATERDPSVSLKDPVEDESQRHLELGTLALEMGDLEKAIAEYQKSIEVQENASAYYNIGVCKYQEQDLEGAISAWKEALRLSPDSPDAHTNLASAYVMSKPSRPDLAIEHLQTAASQTPDDAEIQFNLGAVLEACEQLEGAVEAYKKASLGGIERAEQNVRNCTAKLMAARLEVERKKKAGELPEEITEPK
ncbi:uncharacterized protein MJAP1_003881 [Malassezia japonica]|uniref:Uncharacterized protein n=1 Tax=Malassezia japonica TaxID=223818 RepID=A0AAF0JC41_9BASI|nr:uncharacterized protein MJAP1_003881 [Malassezia japonica]WFD40890.1 hypothetical protein MJAP1_003881 [Malassezia japonica]